MIRRVTDDIYTGIDCEVPAGAGGKVGLYLGNGRGKVDGRKAEGAGEDNGFQPGPGTAVREQMDRAQGR